MANTNILMEHHHNVYLFDIGAPKGIIYQNRRDRLYKFNAIVGPDKLE